MRIIIIIIIIIILTIITIIIRIGSIGENDFNYKAGRESWAGIAFLGGLDGPTANEGQKTGDGRTILPQKGQGRKYMGTCANWREGNRV